MATLKTETWTGSNGAAWPSQWTPLANNGAATIQSNRGAMTVNATGYLPNRRAIASFAQKDVELYIEFIPQATTESYIDFCVRQDMTKAGYYPDGYFVSCDLGGGLWTLGAVDSTNGQFSNTDSLAAFDTTPWAVRLRAITDTANTAQSVLQAKVWKVSAGEPATWTQTKSLNSYERAGSVSVGYTSGGSTNPGIQFDNMTVTDGAATAPLVSTAGMMMAF